MNLKYLWMAFIAFLLFSCNQNSSTHNEETGHKHEHETATGHEHEKIQYTVYSNNFELFAKSDAMVVGEPAEIIAHFTKLEDFKPLESGKLTVTLNVNGKTVTQTVEAPEQKGIYHFSIQPVTAGEGTLHFQIASANTNSDLTIPDVDVFANHNELHEHHEHGHEHEATPVNTTVFTKSQSWKTNFTTAYPEEKAFGPVIKTVAKIEPARGSEEVVAAKASGLVVFSNNKLEEGSNVTKGEKLFSISSNEMLDNNFAVQLAEAKSNYETSKANYQRKSELAKDRLVSEQELLNAQNTYETSKAIYDNLSKNFNTSGQLVYSNLNGFIKQIFVSNGQYVAAGQALASISQNNKLLLTAQVQQKYLPLLPSAVSANITTQHNHKTYTLEELGGKILTYGKSATDGSFLFPVSLEIGNHAGFVPGTFVDVYLKTLTNTKALTVPNTALLEEQGIYYMFVQRNPELFEKREVKIGGTDGLNTEIISGLHADERVVTNGAMQVKLAHSTGGLDPHAGHVH